MLIRTADIGYRGKVHRRLADILFFCRWVIVPIARWGGVPEFVLRA
jgi:hypothetical protein